MLATHAPSVFVYRPRLAPTPGGRKPARPLLYGLGLSLIVHLGLIALFAGSSRATVTSAARDEAPIALTLFSPPTPLEAPTAAPSPSPSAAPPTRSARRRIPVSRQPVATAATADVTHELAPEVEPTSPIDKVVESTSPAPPRTLPPPPAPVEARPFLVSPSVGQGLRLEDEYPQLPQALRVAGFSQTVMVQICVSARGAVQQIQFTTDVPGSLLRVLEPAIRRWQYRSLLIGGAAVPFCHQMRIEYRMT